MFKNIRTKTTEIAFLSVLSQQIIDVAFTKQGKSYWQYLKFLLQVLKLHFSLNNAVNSTFMTNTHCLQVYD